MTYLSREETAVLDAGFALRARGVLNWGVNEVSEEIVTDGISSCLITNDDVSVALGRLEMLEMVCCQEVVSRAGAVVDIYALSMSGIEIASRRYSREIIEKAIMPK